MNTIDPKWTDLAERLQGRLFATVRAPELPRDRRTIAYHESAHVVAMMLTGGDVGHVTIEAGPAFAGMMVAATPNPEWTPHPAPLAVPILPAERKPWALCLSASCFAGRQGELLLHGVDVMGCLFEDASDDAIARYILSSAWGPLRGTAPIGGAQKLARTMLVANWGAVSAVADLLLQHGTIDADLATWTAAMAQSATPSFPGPPAAADAAVTRAPTPHLQRRHARDFFATEA